MKAKGVRTEDDTPAVEGEIKLSKEAAKKYRRLWASWEDLLAARSFAALMAKGWFEEPWTRRRSALLHQEAFTTALVVSYARAFMDPKHWEQYVLGLADEISAERLRLHRELMKMRNQIFTHSDLRLIHVRPLLWENS